MQINRHAVSKIIPTGLIKAKKWLWIFVPWVFLELLKHRLFSWANEQIDRMAAVLGPHMTPALLSVEASLRGWASGHPFELFMSFVGIYCTAIVTHTWRSITHKGVLAQGADPRSHRAALSDRLERISPDGIEIHIRALHPPDSGIDGLLMSITNRGERTLDSCRAVVESFRSFDSRRQSFRVESAGNAEIVRFSAVRPDYESGSYWFVRINKQSEQLEIGNTTGKGTMLWPPKAPASTQKWLLTVRLEGEVRTDQARSQPLPVWRFDVCVEWTRPNTLKVGHPPQ